MSTTVKQKKQQANILATLNKLKDSDSPPVVQEVATHQKSKKIGRKKHALEGVEYERLGVKVPAELKNEMVIAMKSTHKEYKTMDLFVSEALRVFLSLKR